GIPEISAAWQGQSICRMGIIFPWVRYKADVPDKQAQIRYIYPSEGSVISKNVHFLGRNQHLEA
ncbi:MAG: hypothetical protein LBL56_05160, partial [Treponema sp.]|nr:hypothetical protein [Treponema sp.]